MIAYSVCFPHAWSARIWLGEERGAVRRTPVIEAKRVPPRIAERLDGQGTDVALAPCRADAADPHGERASCAYHGVCNGITFSRVMRLFSRARTSKRNP
jgi:hypothetical protein